MTLKLVNYRNIRCYTDGKNHYPSVHSLISLITGKSWVNEDAAMRGTILHASTALKLRGEDTEVPALYQRRIKPLFEWIDDAKLNPVHIEETLISEWGWAGTPDLITDSCIYDWKFAEQILYEYELQMQAYRMLMEDESYKACLVQINKAGDIRSYPLGWNEEAAKLLKAAQEIMNFRLRKRRNAKQE